ncbi:MAG: alanine racemase [Acidobacteria bacterium]|nr:alanine racemase [Acidobacteriota bacterium]
MNSFDRHRPTWAETSLSALTHNYAVIKKDLRHGANLMAVVKADAYGHGAVQCARALQTIDADWFGVALVEEGIVLRRAGITRPIFCLGGFWQGQAEDAIDYDLTTAVYRLDSAEELNARARAAGRIVPFHLKVDTGMGRLGVMFSEVAGFAQALKQFDSIKLDGVMTNFADASGRATGFTEQQIERYNEVLETLQTLGFDPTWRHLANSAGIHVYPHAHGNLARAGATLYGLTRDVLAPGREPYDLWPVMSLRSKLVMLKRVPPGTPLGYGCTFKTDRPSVIATIPIGYADGWSRAHSNNGRVIVRGQFAPIVGRVSMDLSIVDVTDLPEIEIGETATLVGEQDGLRITAEEVAARIGTISYEIVTGISARVPRIFA